MGSRIMHLIIANKIAEHFSVSNKSSFLLGGVAPDAVAPKDHSHFFIGEVHEYSRRVDFESFLIKYNSLKHSHYILGYYTHLIADDIWLQGFFLPWLRNRLENNKELFKLYHNDFRLLNGKLLEYYGCTNKLRAEIQIPDEVLELGEVKTEEVKNFIPYVLEDMEYNQETLNQPLHVFTFEQIVGYIETSVERGIYQLRPLFS
ncbi:zinc dependent phospholipase C family protein [Heyndrickxia camelliae]|uniref:Hydrolase n=1 Tax=Heyndrickxia camelliae TaxID=1707093 RepID=A0A2N3LDV2_9BACI|nr:zinc dependent phospholipase C family protein [Heyndrickxia camelliae]PKR82733.1 hydrolase [Heyndrickxia camelliae]